MAARLKEKYHKEIKQALQKELGLENLDGGAAGWRRSSSTWAWAKPRRTPSCSIRWWPTWRPIAGQKPVTTKAKKSIAAFKVRAGMSIGAMVTLRTDKATSFLTA